MPCTYTHYLFAKDLYKSLDDDVKRTFQSKENYFYLFGQSFDIFFFKNYSLGHYAHTHKSNLYFKNIIYSIKENNLYDNQEVLAYLYGSICHYVLDSIVHPYIFYNTGIYNYKNKKTYKYKGKHNYYEYMIDAILYEDRYNKKIYKTDIANEALPKLKFGKELNNIIDNVFINTFNYKSVSRQFSIGLRNFRFVVKYVFQSRYGIKYYLYRIIDKFNIVKNKKLSYMCYYIKKLDYSVLNLEHNKWYYPVDKKMSYHYSFYDLYDIALLKAKDIIVALNSALDKDDKEIKKVLKLIGNLSYTNGKNVDKNFKMKYFRY